VRGGTTDDARLAGFVGYLSNPVLPPPGLVAVTPSTSRGGVTCLPATGATRLYAMAPTARGDLSNVSLPGGDVYLGYLAGQHKIPDGSCATDDRAHERWTSPSGTGLLACMNPYDGLPWIYFSFGKGKYLAFATRDDSNYAALYQWWAGLKTFLP
jgi:hypothetical protein